MEAMVGVVAEVVVAEVFVLMVVEVVAVVEMEVVVEVVAEVEMEVVAEVVAAMVLDGRYDHVLLVFSSKLC